MKRVSHEALRQKVLASQRPKAHVMTRMGVAKVVELVCHRVTRDHERAAAEYPGQAVTVYMPIDDVAYGRALPAICRALRDLPAVVSVDTDTALPVVLPGAGGVTATLSGLRVVCRPMGGAP